MGATADCPLRCGEGAITWLWIGGDPGARKASVREIDIYQCPECGVFGISDGLCAALGGGSKREKEIARQFVAMRDELFKRRTKESPSGARLIGVFRLSPDRSVVELVFVTPRDPRPPQRR
ncbi:MAG TPA: hypothetical protein VK661_09215 [Planctomycetota bacterium]|jgi:hypothetical protein|nr:hypothetical protein [Planctomycetota bacterium]